MAHIQLKSVFLNYPVYGTHSRSIKHSLINATTGGRLKTDSKTVVINALNDISLHLKKGDRLGLIGHNGSGKSTLLRLMAGIYAPSQGEVHTEGTVGTLFDTSFGMELESTGYENIKIRGMIMGLSKKEIARVIPEIEAFTEMGDFLEMPVRTYSAGMFIRLGFALSTIIPSSLLLVDEAIGAGDANFMEKAYQRMVDFIHMSDVLVLASHSNEAIAKFCNKVLWLHHGSVRALGDTDAVLEAYAKG